MKIEPEQKMLLDDSHKWLADLQALIRCNSDNMRLLHASIVTTIQNNKPNVIRELNDETIIVLCDFANFAIGMALATMELPPERSKH